MGSIGNDTKNCKTHEKCLQCLLLLGTQTMWHYSDILATMLKMSKFKFTGQKRKRHFIL